MNKLKIRINSFSYKNKIPEDGKGNGGGFVFDCRCLENPGKYSQYKELTGNDLEVINFFSNKKDIKEFLKYIYLIVDLTIKKYLLFGFSDLQINFGCTGGQHRSVYCANKLFEHLINRNLLTIELTHININILK